MTKILQVVVSFALVTWLVSQMDFRALGENISDADWSWFLLANLLSLGTLICGVWKWQLLLRAQGTKIPTGVVSRYFLIGPFFSNFLPSNVGGDVVRVSLVVRHVGRQHWPTAVGSVFVERVTGLLGLLLVLPIGLALHYDWVISLNILVALVSALGGITALIFVAFSEWGAKILAWFGRFPIMGKPVGFVQKLHNTLFHYRDNRRVIFQCILISCLFYVISAVQISWLLKAFPGMEVPWTTQIVTFCSVSLLASLPIAFNGYGVQESGYVFFFLSLGFSHNQAVILALANRALGIVISIIGGFLFATSNFSRADIITPHHSGESNEILSSGTVAS